MSANFAINLSTFGGALRHGYRIVAMCPACKEHRKLDLARYPANEVFIDRRFRCCKCGTVGSISVSQITTGGGGTLPALMKWRSRPDRL